MLKVGNDIKYFCTRCNLELGHRILAMVGSEPARLRCNTCQSERNYRASKRQPLSSSQKEKERPSARKLKSPDFYEQKLQASLMKTPKTYRIDLEVEEGDVVDHKIFGRGIVIKAIPPDRMEILFKEEVKVLACRVLASASSGA